MSTLPKNRIPNSIVLPPSPCFFYIGNNPRIPNDLKVEAVVWWVPRVGGVDFQPRTRVHCVKVVEEGTRCGVAVSMNLDSIWLFCIDIHLVSKRTEQAAGTSDTHGGRKPQTTSYRKEKQQATKKEVASSGDPGGDAIQDEASQVHKRDLRIGDDERMVSVPQDEVSKVHERDIHIGPDESRGATSESSESIDKAPSEQQNKSSSGATSRNVEEREDDPSAPLLGGPINLSLPKSF
ncbi:hypothetical protein Scep_029680 [Stephania cephalantha]|uniref:Uncharacterized protein n=1 Tax=Stephania cephalantha TaxID=152367 RepID=A0AAP0DY61_9MAGN